MADNVISATTTVDLGGLKAYQTAAETAATATQRLTVAMEAASRAAGVLASSVAPAAANFSALAAATTSASAATNSASLTATEFRTILAEENSVMALAIQRNTELSSARNTAAGGLGNAQSAANSYTASIRRANDETQSFIGLIPGLGRAAERFVGIVPGLGSLIMGAIPLLGAVALAEDLIRIGNAAIKTSETFRQLEEATKNLATVTKQADQEFEALNKQFERVEVERLTLEFGKLKGAGLDSFFKGITADRAADEIKRLEGLIANSRKRMAEDSKPTTNPLISTLEAFNPLITGMKLANLENFKAEEKNIQAYEIQIELLRQRLNLAKEEQRLDKDKQVKDAAEDKKRAEAEALRRKREETAALRDADVEALADLRANHELSIAETIRFWKARLADESDNTQRYKDISRTLGELYQEQDKAFDRLVKHGIELTIQKGKADFAAQEKQGRYFDELDHMLDENARKEEESARRVADAHAKANEAITGGALQLDKLAVERQYATALDQTAIAQQKLAEATLESDKKILQDRLNMDAQIIANDKKKGVSFAEDQTKMVQDATRGQQQIYASQTRILAQQAAQYRVFFTTITSGVTSMVSGWLSGERTLLSGLRSIWVNLIGDFTKLVEQRVVHWLAGTAAIQGAESLLSTILVALHLKDAAATASTKATADTAAVVSDKVAASQMILDAAAVAGANAFAATAIIPFVGPELAPGVAAAAFGTALSYEGALAFHTGTDYVPRTGYALLQAGERVISTGQNEQITNALTGGGGSTFGDTHIHVNGGNGGRQAGIDAATQFKQQLRRMNLLTA